MKTWDAMRTRLGSLLDGAFDGAVLFFGVWTVVFQIGLWVRLSAPVLLFATVLATAATWWGLRHLTATDPAPIADEVPWLSRGSRTIAAIAVVAAVGAVLALHRGQGILFWLLAVAAVGSAGVAVWRSPIASSQPAQLGTVLVAVVALSAALGSLLQRDWVADNTYYVDRMMAVADSGGYIPVARDTLYSDREYPGVAPENDLASFSALVGAVGAVIPLHPMSILSFGALPAVAFLGVLALWRAARSLGHPGPGLVAALGTIGFLLLAGTAQAARFGFTTRTGRTALILWLIPAVIAYGVRALRDGDRRSAILLLAAGVGAGGATLTAFLVIPLVLMGVVLALTPQLLAGWRWFGAAVGGIALYYLILALVSVGLRSGYPPGDAMSTPTVLDLWGEGVGSGRLGLLATFGLLVAWIVVTPGASRRFVLAATGMVLLVAVNPVVVPITASTPAAPSLERAIWALGLQVVIGLALASLVVRFAAMGWALTGAVLIGAATIGSGLAILEPHAPSWDVRPVDARAAARLVSLVPSGSRVAAPWRTAAFVGVVSDDVYPLGAVRRHVLGLGDIVGPDFMAEERMTVQAWIIPKQLSQNSDGRIRRASGKEGFADALRVLDVRAVCVDPRLDRHGVRPTLEAVGFRVVDTDAVCEYWVKSD